MEIKNEAAKVFYFDCFKRFWLIKRVKRSKLNVAKLYSDQRLKRKSFDMLHLNMLRVRRIQELCNRLRMKEVTLSEMLQISSIKPSLIKLIFALNHYRMKIMRKIFDKFRHINLFR
jgi:hypothetical protein